MRADPWWLALAETVSSVVAGIAGVLFFIVAIACFWAIRVPGDILLHLAAWEVWLCGGLSLLGAAACVIVGLPEEYPESRP